VSPEEVPEGLLDPPEPDRRVRLVGIAAQASWHAIAKCGRTTVSLGFYVVDRGGVVPAVGAGVVPSGKD
jgi:hypothetical protein